MEGRSNRVLERVREGFEEVMLRLNPESGVGLSEAEVQSRWRKVF